MKQDPHESPTDEARDTERGSATGGGGSDSWLIREMPERLRPREEMERLGVENVSDEVLLAVLLRTGVKGRSVLALTRQLLRQHGSLSNLARCSVRELRSTPGIGRVKALTLAAALDIGRRMAEESRPKQYRIRQPEDAARLLRDRAMHLDQEVFWVLLLDKKNQLKGHPIDITRGLLDASLVHPREVFQEAVRAKAAAVVVLHNHPSGDPTPSAEDIRITRQLVEAGKIVDIQVLDHVVLGSAAANGRGFASMREEGMLSFADANRGWQP